MSNTSKNKPKELSKNLFPVVGIGASAGGLAAFKKFVKAIPRNSGMAYILVQHLHPEYESVLPEILQRVTETPVVEISDNVKVEPNHVYVIPSNKILIATDGVLKLDPRAAKGLNMPIDIFFSSLAEVHQAHSIGVILSGTGADGTSGLKDIKNHGGYTFAQSAATSSYADMPQHAIDAEIIDFVLAPEQIPGKLIELQQSFSSAAPGEEPVLKDKTDEESFRGILALLKIRSGVDFNFYKQTTVRRRIVRRMVILHLDTLTNYLGHLNNNKTEFDILFQDLLIPVTSFFRDAATYDILCKNVIPVLLQHTPAGDTLRVWVAGCSTGQEAYSIAICLQEYMNDHAQNSKVQIFATDISEKSLAKARSGIYTKKELDGISETRLQQFFNKIDGTWQVKIIQWVGATSDIHEQKIKEEKKDEFISVASHEMKTPITTAKAYLQLLEEAIDKKNGDAVLYSAKTSQAVGRLHDLVNDLLDVSKIQYGKLDYNITAFDFNKMVEEVIENIQYSSPIHSIKKTGKVSGKVTGDEDRLQQVIINLLTNAVKYSPKAKKVLINVAKEKDEIKVAVTDFGIGMPKANLEKIFERYYRVETDSVHFQGLGIGLYISYEIIKRHGGRLWAESELGKGSTFYFTLPVRPRIKSSGGEKGNA